MSTWRDVTTAMIGYNLAQKFGREEVAAFIQEVQARGVTADEALAAIRDSRGQFLPSAGAIAGIVDVHRQGPAPTWRAAHGIIARHIGLLPYHHPEDGWEAFIEALTSEHESVARFATQIGPRGVREMPDPNYNQGTSGSVALTRLEREWRDTADEWRADQQRDLALDVARRRAIGGGMADIVEGLRPAAEIERKTA